MESSTLADASITVNSATGSNSMAPVNGQGNDGDTNPSLSFSRLSLSDQQTQPDEEPSNPSLVAVSSQSITTPSNVENDFCKSNTNHNGIHQNTNNHENDAEKASIALQHLQNKAIENNPGKDDGELEIQAMEKNIDSDPPINVEGHSEMLPEEEENETNENVEEDAEVDEDESEEDEEEEEEESSEISASDEDGSWIAWFCSLRGNEFFCEVDEDYIQDDFNLTGLNNLVPYYDYALDMVLDVELSIEDALTEEQQEIVESAAEMLYGLIHARYIVTNRGMHAMNEKYRSGAFGRCPRVFCQGQPTLPVGLSDLPRNYTVHVFCPRCHGLFFPKSARQANIDGAYFGTTFPHLYLMTHPDMIPIKPSQTYEPRVYGFKVHKSSLYYRNHEEPQVPTEIVRSRRHMHRKGRMYK